MSYPDEDVSESKTPKTVKQKSKPPKVGDKFRPKKPSSARGDKPIEEYNEDVLYGIALCHREDHRDLKTLFPQLAPFTIKWKYLNLLGVPAPNLIIGSMFESEVLSQALLGERGYDYVIETGCGLNWDVHQLILYNLTAPLIAASCLLSDKGTTISRTFFTNSVQFYDKEGIMMKKKAEQDLDSRDFTALDSYLVSESPDERSILSKRRFVDTTTLTQDDFKLLKLKIHNVYRKRIDRLSRDEDILAKIAALSDNICYLAGYKEWERYNGPRNEIHTAFNKSVTVLHV